MKRVDPEEVASYGFDELLIMSLKSQYAFSTDDLDYEFEECNYERI